MQKPTTWQSSLRRAASKSPERKGQGRKPNSIVKRRLTSVDIVTGKELVYVYFDPAKVIENPTLSNEWVDENLFTPASIVKEENGALTVRLINGTILSYSLDELFEMPLWF